MKNFTALEFAGFLTAAASERHVEKATKDALEQGAIVVRDEAKRVLGTYEYGWAPLAPSTLARKAADTPGVETGEMRDSIEYIVTSHDACIGSDLDRALFFELGTSKQPARSFLAGAVQHKLEDVLQAVQHEFVKKLFGL